MTEAREPRTVDLTALARAAGGRRFAWGLQSEDLNLNLMALVAGSGVDEHLNREVDVLLVGVDGEGVVEVEGRPHTLQAGQALLVPKGTRRSLRCSGERFVYLTCHRRRRGLQPEPLQRREPA